MQRYEDSILRSARAHLHNLVCTKEVVEAEPLFELYLLLFQLRENLAFVRRVRRSSSTRRDRVSTHSGRRSRYVLEVVVLVLVVDLLVARAPGVLRLVDRLPGRGGGDSAAG